MNHSSWFGREATAAGLVFIVLAALTVLPQFALIAVWLLPMPLIVFTVLKARIVTPFLALAAGGSLLAVGFGWSALLFALGIYFIGWVMGESIASSESPYMPLITGTLVLVMLELVLLALVRFSGTDIYSALTSQINQSLQQDAALFKVNQASLPAIVKSAVDWVRMMIPGLLVVFAFLWAAVNLLLARLILGEKAGPRKPLLSTWRLPNSIVVVYVIALIFAMFGGFKNYSVFAQLVNNTMFLAGFFIGIQGLAFIWRKIGQRKTRYVWLVLLLIASTFRIVGDLFVLIGLFDSVRTTRRPL